MGGGTRNQKIRQVVADSNLTSSCIRHELLQLNVLHLSENKLARTLPGFRSRLHHVQSTPWQPQSRLLVMSQTHLVSDRHLWYHCIYSMCNKVIYPNPLTALFRVIPPLPRIYFKMVFSSTNTFVNPSFFPFFNICIYWYFARCAVSTVYRTDSSTYECSL